MVGTNGRRAHRVNTTGNLQHSMRANYIEHGVENYYKQVGASYRNPHFPGVRACMFTWLGRWWMHERDANGSRSPVIFDMACGSGEVTVATYEWWKRDIPGMQPRRNVERLSSQGGCLAESSNLKKKVPDDLLIVAADPYTRAAYSERTTLPCAPLSFRDISQGMLPPNVSALSSIGHSSTGSPDSTIDRIDMVVCSFALHLVESPSELFALLWELSTKASWLVVLAPHKKPEIREGWGWVKWDSEYWSPHNMQDRKEFSHERVHCRVYRSVNIPDEAVHQ